MFPSYSRTHLFNCRHPQLDLRPRLTWLSLLLQLFGMLSVCVITCKTGSRRSGYQPLYAWSPPSLFSSTPLLLLRGARGPHHCLNPSCHLLLEPRPTNHMTDFASRREGVCSEVLSLAAQLLCWWLFLFVLCCFGFFFRVGFFIPLWEQFNGTLCSQSFFYCLNLIVAFVWEGKITACPKYLFKEVIVIYTYIQLTVWYDHVKNETHLK